MSTCIRAYGTAYVLNVDVYANAYVRIVYVSCTYRVRIVYVLNVDVYAHACAYIMSHVCKYRVSQVCPKP